MTEQEQQELEMLRKEKRQRTQQQRARAALEVAGVKVYAVDRLQDVICILKGDQNSAQFLLEADSSDHQSEAFPEPEVDFADIIGQSGAKRGVEIAAAGGHNLLLIGSPGCGKSSLAKAMAAILLPMTAQEPLITII